jgi:hypothetical protein
MQRLIDAAMVVEAVVVPSLSAQFRQKVVHAGSISKTAFETAMKQI